MMNLFFLFFNAYSLAHFSVSFSDDSPQLNVASFASVDVITGQL